MISTVLVLGVIVLLWSRIEPLLVRTLAIAEQRAAAYAESAKKPGVIEGDPMPEELLRFALEDSEPWARDDKIKWMHELYAESKDWSIVQNQMLTDEGRERLRGVA